MKNESPTAVNGLLDTGMRAPAVARSWWKCVPSIGMSGKN
jgi:hypothetical protein